LFRTFRPPAASAWSRPGQIGFVLHSSPPRRKSVPNPQSEIEELGSFCMSDPTELGLFRTNTHHRDAEGTENEADACLPGRLWGLRLQAGTPAHVSSFRFRIINRKSSMLSPRTTIRGMNQTVPLPVARVARIVPEFCARARPEGRVTPCDGRNKEFLARGVFPLFNCCTNVVVRSVGTPNLIHRVYRIRGISGPGQQKGANL